MSDTEIRDGLAVLRTHLANERTLLSYVRAAVGLAAAGAALLKFFGDSRIEWLLGGVLLGVGILVGVFGTIRFLAARRRIAALRRP